MRELEPRLQSVLKREGDSTPPKDLLTFAKIASIKKRYSGAAALYRDALERQPALQDSRDILVGQSQRYYAACSAALAGLGKGEDAADLDSASRARWRHRAIKWLHEDLAALQRKYSTENQQSSKRLAQALKSWRRGALKFLENEETMTAIPASEIQAWTALRTAVDRRIKELE